jgi:hypothetical protein
MSNIEAILTSVEFWKITAPAVFGIIAWLVNERSKRQWERWQLKKVACLKALNIANAILSNYKYTNVESGDITPQHESVESIRACFNDLACTCDGSEVIEGLKKIMFEEVTPAEIVSLRTAVRKELGMGRQAIDHDTEHAFVGKVNCEKPQ